MREPHPIASTMHVVWWASLILSGLWVVTSVSYPLGWDHGIMAAVGDAIVRGGMPYRDAWDMKGPVAFVPFAMVQMLVGPTQWGIRIFDLVILGICTAGVVQIGRIVASHTVARWAGVIWFLWYASLSFFFTAQPDAWVGAGFTLATWLLLDDRAGPRLPYVLAGVMAGTGALVKPFYVMFLIVPMFAAMARVGRSPRLVSHGAWTMVGVTFPVTLALGAFWVTGTLGDLYDVYIGYTSTSYVSMSLTTVLSRIQGLFAFFWGVPAGLVLPVAVFGAYMLVRERRSAAVILLSWLAVGVVGVALQGRFFVYHWIPVLPALIVLAATGVDVMVRSAEGSREPSRPPHAVPSVSPTRVFAGVLTLLMLGGIVFTPIRDVAHFLAMAVGLESRQEYYSRFRFENDPYRPWDDMMAARHIQEHTEADETVAVIGYNAAIGFLSGRPLATRFVFQMPLARGGPVSSIRDAYREEFLADLRRHRPEFIALGYIWGGEEWFLDDFGGFAEWFTNGYAPDTTFGTVRLYRRE